MNGPSGGQRGGQAPGVAPAGSNEAEPRWKWRVLRAGRLMLDAGSMFGLVPKAVWSKTVKVDDQERIGLHHNCVLLEGPPEQPGGRNRIVVVETGSGNKLPAKMKGIFGLEDRWVADALREAGCDTKDVDGVVVSHLHFDHAGGLTRLAGAGEKPVWSGDDLGGGGGAGVVWTFENAWVSVQEREWVDALKNRSVMTRTYYPDHVKAIEERLRCKDSPRAFPTGYVPDRDELPRVGVMNRRSEVLPGLWVFSVPGHTWGQQGVMWRGEDGEMVVFVPDMMPTAWHVGAAYSLSYDVEPYTSMVTKRWLLTEAAAGKWTLVLDHEPGNPVRRAVANSKGWFDLEEA